MKHPEVPKKRANNEIQKTLDLKASLMDYAYFKGFSYEFFSGV